MRAFLAWLDKLDRSGAHKNLLVILVFGMVGAVVAGAAQGILDSVFSDRAAAGQTLEQRIEVLTRSLSSAAAAVSAIENEVRARQQLVEGLRQDAATAAALAQANRQQVDAVAQVLRAEIERDKQAGFWADMLKNFGFTMFGWMLGELSGWWRRRRSDRAAGSP
jgi:hypothetical protein